MSPRLHVLAWQLNLAAIGLCILGCSSNTDPAPRAKAEAPRPQVADKAPETKITAAKPDDKKLDEKAKKDAEAAEEAKAIQEERAKLSPADRELVNAQEWCVIQNDERLGGAMGAPVKLVIKDKVVFLCCGHCKKEALANPDKTLAKLEELKAKKKALDAAAAK